MSLAQLQEATAYLVRFPESGRGQEWETFVKRYDLTVHEIAQLDHVAHNGQVVKYGKKLRKFRYIDVVEALPTPEVILGEALFETLWFEHFEPVAASIATEDLAHEFLQLLVTDTRAGELIAEKAPAHAREFLIYLAAESALQHRPEACRGRALPAGSLLRHGAVFPFAFHYDVPKIIEKDSDQALLKPRRAPKPFYYVLLLKGDAPNPALFAIDRAVHDFLKAQLEDPGKSPPKPTVYADLVKAGIVSG